MLRGVPHAQASIQRAISTFHRDRSSDIKYTFAAAPLCFVLVIDKCIRPISSEINIWFLDEEILDGAPETIATEPDTLTGKLLDISLQMSTVKCEVTFLRQRGSQQHHDALAHVQWFLTDLKEVDPSELTLLGSPPSEGGFESTIETAKTISTGYANEIYLSMLIQLCSSEPTNYVSAPS